ncbi:MAG TPA: flagellar M-ring protein FliF C-terminal domain-containing protein [Anaerolineae bacterium]|jgi:flagellar M-ring protein FliF|nr:flagellar M-ring protein FliF C-terminal domain-containing protein [Anaerolineae bacterium]
MVLPTGRADNAKVSWQRLEAGQKIIIAITITLLLVAIGSFIYWILQPPYAVLLSDISPEDASAITARLHNQRLGVQENYTKTQLGIKDAYENSLEESIGSMLNKVLGNENSAVVRVSAEIDFAKTETRINKVERGEDSVAAREQTRDFTRISEHTIKPPGTVKKLSVAVVVNNDGKNPALTNKIKNLVATAAGIDRSRGDVLTISSIPFNTEWMNEEGKAIGDIQERETYVNYGKYAIIAVLFMIGLIALLKLTANFMPAGETEELTPKPVSALGREHETAVGVDASWSTLSAWRGSRRKQKKRQITEIEIQSLARERPGDIAQLMKIWLNT